MDIKEFISLAEHTTFKVGGPARFFCSVADEGELVEAVSFAMKKSLPIFILGGGSNLLVSDKGFPGLVVKMEIVGIAEKGAGTSGSGAVIIEAGAGEMWDSFVYWAVERGLHGIENLSAIPGTVGASPVQNIGAYGAEASQVISSVRALDTQAMKFVELSNADCQFDYRDSMFKHEKGRYVVVRVSFKLSTDAPVNIAYKDLQDHFEARAIAAPTLEQVRQAVIDVRWGKLPDWKLWGTAGSFFKNPIVTAEHFAELKKAHPGLPGYPETDGRVKVSLGWILDKICDVKGLCMDRACVYERQALVLVTLPGATAESVVELSNELMKRVKDRTGLDIECEVEWVN